MELGWKTTSQPYDCDVSTIYLFTQGIQMVIYSIVNNTNTNLNVIQLQGIRVHHGCRTRDGNSVCCGWI
jgi:hypothetical protein